MGVKETVGGNCTAAVLIVQSKACSVRDSSTNYFGQLFSILIFFPFFFLSTRKSHANKLFVIVSKSKFKFLFSQKKAE